MRLAQFVAKRAGGLVQVVNEKRVLGHNVRNVMVDDDPVRFVHPLFEIKIGHPPGFLPQFALSPGMIMVGLQRHVRIEELTR